MNVRGTMSISSYVHMILIVEIEGEVEHSKVLVLFKGVTPKMNKGQNTLSTWESVKLIAKIIIFYPLLEWTNRHCSCVELVEYIPFYYSHVAFGVWMKKL